MKTDIVQSPEVASMLSERLHSVALRSQKPRTPCTCAQKT